VVWWIDAEITADFSHELVADFRMTRDGGAAVQRSIE
jgi:hypothetical protein